MQIDRLILISFLGNYLINTFTIAIVAMLPLSGNVIAQRVIYFVLAVIGAAAFTRWYLMTAPKDTILQNGVMFGVCACLVAIITTLVSGISGVLAQTGSFSQLLTVFPEFVPFIWNWSTLALVGYWILPSATLGFWMQTHTTT